MKAKIGFFNAVSLYIYLMYARKRLKFYSCFSKFTFKICYFFFLGFYFLSLAIIFNNQFLITLHGISMQSFKLILLRVRSFSIEVMKEIVS